MNKINTWQQGRFIVKPKYNHWSDEDKQKAHADESLKVRPSPEGNAICFCSNPDDAKWIAKRLNVAANLEKKDEIKTTLEHAKECADEANIATIEILTTVLASLDEENDIEKAVIYGVTNHIKRKHGFVEAMPYDYRPFREQAIQALERVGDDYNPYMFKAYAVRKIVEDE
jgi:hypothetical protein